MTKIYYFDNPNSPIGNSVVSLSPNFEGDSVEAVKTAIKDQGLPESTRYQEVEDALDPIFKNARKVEAGELVADLKKSRIIAHQYRRIKRSDEFFAIDGDNEHVRVTTSAEVQRKSIRDKYDIIQANLDAKSTVAELRAEMQKEGLI